MTENKFKLSDIKYIQDFTNYMEKRQKDLPTRLNARRKLMTKVNKVEGVDLVDRLFNEIAPKYEGRVGGYSRILKMEPRKGDNAESAILMLV